MPDVELSAGIVEYQDTGGSGPVVVLLHGLAMDGSLWRHIVRELGDEYRCVVPTLPLGGHRRPMRADADLSPGGIARLEAELLEALDLREVTLVGNDSGLFQLAAAEHPQEGPPRVGVRHHHAGGDLLARLSEEQIRRFQDRWIDGGIPVQCKGFPQARQGLLLKQALLREHVVGAAHPLNLEIIHMIDPCP